MKLSKPFKKKVRNDDDDDSSSLYGNKRRDEEGGSSSVADWAVTDSSKFKRLSKDAKTEGKRAPELWIPDGESRLVRYVDNEPIASFKRYSFKHNGKWRQFVAPPEGKTDLFASQLGLKAQRVFLFRVIDINGYKDKKKGKTYRNLPRFQVASTRAFDQITMMSEENADAGELNEYNVKISRSGTGTSTSYLYMPRPVEKMTPEMKKAIAQFPKFTDYYKPLSRAQQEAIVAAHGGGSSNEDEDDE
jgi:hypothetical protein